MNAEISPSKDFSPICHLLSIKGRSFCVWNYIEQKERSSRKNHEYQSRVCFPRTIEP